MVLWVNDSIISATNEKVLIIGLLPSKELRYALGTIFICNIQVTVKEILIPRSTLYQEGQRLAAN